MCEGQGHRSNVKVNMLENVIFFKDFFVISLRFDLEVKGHMGQGQIRVPNKGRWAHNNVKLHSASAVF